ENQDEPLVASGARVRIQSPHLAAGWHEGTMMGDRCLGVGIPSDPGTPRWLYVLASIEQLQVSSTYDGRHTPGQVTVFYTAEADTTGEEWIDVDMDDLREDDSECGSAQG
ncbi:MAG: hypothetical protein O7D29_06145, partial [Gemmatimonadetes bacterium]|nr:hypothetical protein [Gemmatimonadota bacterium]